MLPPAPALLSTTTGTPRLSESFFAMMRAAVSVAPPAANPTMSVIGRVGHVCAQVSPAANSVAAARRMERARFMSAPEGNPGGRVVTRFGQRAKPGVHARRFEPRRRIGIEEQVVDPQSGVAFPR